jgi:predicted ATPase
VIVKLHRSPEPYDEGRLLADEGFGVTKLIGTLLNVEMAILKADGGKEVTIAIEEPENHLHPKYQSLLAEMFADAYKNYGIHFIVETHSEYMVRKLQTLVARKELTPKEVSLQYFYSPDIEQRPLGEPQVKDIPIREDGILLAPFGPGFLDEADNLVTDILTLKAMS